MLCNWRFCYVSLEIHHEGGNKMINWTDYIWIDTQTNQPSDFLMSQINSELTVEQITHFYEIGYELSTKDQSFTFGLRHALQL